MSGWTEASAREFAKSQARLAMARIEDALEFDNMLSPAFEMARSDLSRAISAIAATASERRNSDD